MLGQIAKVLGVEIETKQKEVPKTSAPQFGGSQTVASTVTSTIAPYELQSQAQQVDVSKFKNHFDKVFQENNLPGPDYFELVQAMNNLAQYIPIPEQCLKAAFKSLEPSGLTKEKVEKGINHYIAVAEKDKETFLAAGDQKHQLEITERQNQIEVEKQEIDKIHLLLAQKQKEIGDRQARITTLEIEKQQAEAKISSQKQGYLVIFEQTVGKFKEDLAKIQTIL